MAWFFSSSSFFSLSRITCLKSSYFCFTTLNLIFACSYSKNLSGFSSSSFPLFLQFFSVSTFSSNYRLASYFELLLLKVAFLSSTFLLFAYASSALRTPISSCKISKQFEFAKLSVSVFYVCVSSRVPTC